MQENLTTHNISVGKMHKDRQTMADGRRYIIYYTFEMTTDEFENEPNDLRLKTEESENV